MEIGSVANGKKAVQTDTAPKALGPHSQAIAAGGMIYCAGQIPLDPATGNLELTIPEQITLSYDPQGKFLRSRPPALSASV